MDPELYYIEASPVGKVYLPKFGVSYGDTVEFRYNKVLWSFRILVEGLA